MDKKQIRRTMIEKRNALTEEFQTKYADQIADIVINNNIYRNSENICVYQSFRNEVSCAKIITCAFEDGKSVFVPMTDIKTKTMEFFKITKDTVWQEGAYGILEPVLYHDSQRLQKKAFILMPGLVFDEKKHRIGYGGGYYDKYLSIHKDHITAALCYPFQIITETLPYEKHDILPDYIITNERFF